MRGADHSRRFLFEHVQLGHAVLQDLIGADWLAKLSPHFQIGEGVAVERTHGSVCLGAEGEACVIERRLQQLHRIGHGGQRGGNFV